MLLYQTEDGQTGIEVRLQGETVWMTQAAMVKLFQSSKQNISLHLKNIFNEGELEENRVVKEYLTTAVDGKSYRTAQRAGYFDRCRQDLQGCGGPTGSRTI